MNDLPPDWSVLEVADVAKSIDRAVERVAFEYEWLDRADLAQDARQLVATRVELREVASEPTLLAYRLKRDLIDQIKGHAITDHRLRTTFDPLRVMSDDGEAYGEPLKRITDAAQRAYETTEASVRGSIYSKSEVRDLIPSIFDARYGYGYAWITAHGEVAPTGHHPALVADVGIAWKTALSEEQRQAVYLTAVLDWKQETAAHVLGISQRAVSGRTDRGLDRMVACLNGRVDVAIEQDVAAAA